MLVELVELHHLHGACDDLGEEPPVDLGAIELAGDDEGLEVAIVDRGADLGERAQIWRVERGRIEVPVVGHDRRTDLEARDCSRSSSSRRRSAEWGEPMTPILIRVAARRRGS